MNKFGLFHVYTSQAIPSHDPDDPYSIEHIPQPPHNGFPSHWQDRQTDNPFHPYPNKNMMQLGDWYWNQGAQKSRESFKQLVIIVGTLYFVQATYLGFRGIPSTGNSAIRVPMGSWTSLSGWVAKAHGNPPQSTSPFPFTATQSAQGLSPILCQVSITVCSF